MTMMVRLGVVMTMQLGRVFYSSEPVVDIVPLMNILVDVIPRGLEEVVALQREVVREVVDQEG